MGDIHMQVHSVDLGWFKVSVFQLKWVRAKVCTSYLRPGLNYNQIGSETDGGLKNDLINPNSFLMVI